METSYTTPTLYAYHAFENPVGDVLQALLQLLYSRFFAPVYSAHTLTDKLTNSSCHLHSRLSRRLQLFCLLG